jgi:hypothetical protein
MEEEEPRKLRDRLGTEGSLMREGSMLEFRVIL